MRGSFRNEAEVWANGLRFLHADISLMLASSSRSLNPLGCSVCNGLLSGVVGLMRLRFDLRLCLFAFALLLAVCSTPQLLFAFDSPSAKSDQPSWPVPTSLLEQLDQLQGSSAESWATTTSQLLESIASVSLGSPVEPAKLQIVRTRLGQLGRQSQLAMQVVESLRQYGARQKSVGAADLINQVYRIRYGLDRRIAVWSSLLDVAAKSVAADPQSSFSLAKRGRLSFRSLDDEWSEYLLLDDLAREFNSLSPDSGRQKNSARKTLSRIYSPVLKPEQQEYLQQLFDPQLISMLRQSASTPVDVDNFLRRMEQHEQHPTGATEFRLNDLYQDLVWSEDARDTATAQAIQLHYRNANARLAVSGELLNRMVPEMPATREPVSDQILGASVSGQSYISNRLQVQLIPDPNQVQLRLQTVGTVHSNTVARRDGFAIQNQGLARFQVFQRLAFGRDGVDSSDEPVAYSTADQRVVGMRSKLDGIPFFGRLARKIASQKIEDEAPRTQRLVRSKVEREASERMQEQVETELQQLRGSLYDNVLQPLLALDLEPEPVQMSTTADEVIMRYRLAGRDQMAASSARPAAVAGSLCSCQVHESVMNNTIMRMGLNGQTFTTKELQEHFREMFGTDDVSAADQQEEPPEAQFAFAPLDPIRIRLRDQKVTIELNLASMQIGDGKKWKRLRVKTSYVPRVENGTIVLAQSDDGLRLKGKNLRFTDQVALRTVFEVMFKSEYRVNVLSEKVQERVGSALSITQLVLADGWVGVSIDDANVKKTIVQQARRLPPKARRSGKPATDAARYSRR